MRDQRLRILVVGLVAALLLGFTLSLSALLLGRDLVQNTIELMIVFWTVGITFIAFAFGLCGSQSNFRLFIILVVIWTVAIMSVFAG